MSFRTALFAAAAMAALSACAHSAQPSAAPVSPSPAATSSIPPITVHSRGNARQPVRITQQEGNRRIYELLARSSESTMQSQSQFRSTFSQTHVTFFTADGGTLTGDAPLATIDKASNSVTMQGGVRGKTSEGVVLNCDQLVYERKTGTLHGTGNVHIVSKEGYALSGGSFTSDLKLTHVHME